MLSSVFQYLKGLAIINWGLKALKQLWPFLLAIIFWPEINALLGGLFPFWDKYMATVSSYITNLSSYIRAIPFLGDFFIWLDRVFLDIKVRLVDILQRGI